MEFPLMDEYVAEFEELARQAEYAPGHQELMQLFHKGLPDDVLVKVNERDTQDFTQLKEIAVSITKNIQLMEQMVPGL